MHNIILYIIIFYIITATRGQLKYFSDIPIFKKLQKQFTFKKIW